MGGVEQRYHIAILKRIMEFNVIFIIDYGRKKGSLHFPLYPLFNQSLKISSSIKYKKKKIINTTEIIDKEISIFIFKIKLYLQVFQDIIINII